MRCRWFCWRSKQYFKVVLSELHGGFLELQVILPELQKELRCSFARTATMALLSCRDSARVKIRVTRWFARTATMALLSCRWFYQRYKRVTRWFCQNCHRGSLDLQVLLPASARHELMDQDAMRNGAMLFELKHGSNRTHAGVLDFTGVEGTVGLPSHTSRNVFGTTAIPPGQRITVTYRKLAKGTYCRLQPLTADFHQDVSHDVRDVLEAALLTHSTLTEGDLVSVDFGGKAYDLRVQQLQPEPQISVIGEKNLI
jgi:Ubiquitin fusion degradation protein UFD1